MKHSIFAIIATIGLAIPAAASAATFAESFERDMDRNHTQIPTEIRSGQDNFQQYVNRVIQQWINVPMAGENNPIASFDRDLNRRLAQGGLKTP